MQAEKSNPTIVTPHAIVTDKTFKERQRDMNDQLAKQVAELYKKRYLTKKQK